ncbi:hypothetical protein QJS10_CPA16g00217 [Acorus calamus]|uniref:Uncharacterized protein n=1 Tax=Acorus calamus TaxID=4465 RepID=A0AAV9D1C4_ACOCL|nr:hypothetical protein QJS10_CPA16g00217 [Acorus calamus]
MRGLRRSLVRSVEGQLVHRAIATSSRLLDSNAFNEPDQPSHHAVDEVEHNVSSSVIPTPDDGEAHNRYTYESFDEGDDDDIGEGIPPSFSIFFNVYDDLGEQMHGFSMVFEDDDEEHSTRKGRAQNVTIEEIDAQEQIEPIQPSHQPRTGRAVRAKEVAGLNPHGGMPTVGRGTTRGICDGDPIIRGPGRGYGSGIFIYESDLTPE